MEAPAFEATLVAFLEHLRHVKQSSKHTLLGYENDVRHLAAFLAAKEPRHPALDDLRKLDLYALRSYLAECHRQFATVTVLRRLAAIRTFLKYAKRAGLIETSPAALLVRPSHSSMRRSRQRQPSHSSMAFLH